MRHYKIVNRYRFIAFIVTVCVLISFAVLGFSNICSASDKKSKRYTEVTVMEGDTLWALAGDYGSENKDIRDTIYEICSLNGIKASDLRPGQIILIPQE